MEDDTELQEQWRAACSANDWHALDDEEWQTVRQFAWYYVQVAGEECEDLCDSD